MRYTQLFKNWQNRLQNTEWMRAVVTFMAPTHVGYSMQEKLFAALGGFIGILIVTTISHLWAPTHSAWLMTASMGASAVLLFAAPHAPMSQPWPILGGHLVSAAIGVTFSLLLFDAFSSYVLIAATVGASILAMYLLGCLHPPGGATGLTVIFTAESLGAQAVDFSFLLFPVLTNVLLLLVIAMIFHSLSKKYYPACFAKSEFSDLPVSLESAEVHRDFLKALKQVDSFVDINEQELQRIFELTQHFQNPQHLRVEELQIGAYYSNGALGRDWAVRQILEIVEDDHSLGEKLFVIFKHKAGRNTLNTDCIAISEFAGWAACEVEPAVSGWQAKGGARSEKIPSP